MVRLHLSAMHAKREYLSGLDLKYYYKRDRNSTWGRNHDDRLGCGIPDCGPNIGRSGYAITIAPWGIFLSQLRWPYAAPRTVLDV